MSEYRPTNEPKNPPKASSQEAYTFVDKKRHSTTSHLIPAGQHTQIPPESRVTLSALQRDHSIQASLPTAHRHQELPPLSQPSESSQSQPHQPPQSSASSSQRQSSLHRDQGGREDSKFPPPVSNFSIKRSLLDPPNSDYFVRLHFLIYFPVFCYRSSSSC